ncbi:uncharacterized protein PGTG_14630 [Puccinia graminis f. sp. tritici CRL 75-36-700-3]|uniref:Uncharacterized protein n=1 Tax=Puccinia graminis f. sp. tritici (strain CRL 75-36-700-3 / race SCCL) TaxID=418459 RepID=E3KWJ7_PUCGT|nr:uncharacterized protein PGTG_14630 [Puccinia graminis f. sp. tritici CRL 75-36-700-3]EFP88664.2 hypothetical protein PGTG_14630 [Puccinia graminis f. sp. tritici CRL 75-36-700-3]
MSTITRKGAVETPTTNSEGPRQSTETETPMDVDELDPECSAATQKCPTTPVWKERRALGYFLYFSAPQRVLLRFVVRGNLLDGLVVHSSSVSHTPVSYYLPRCHPLSPPRTPHVTPPTPVGPGTPPAALGRDPRRPPMPGFPARQLRVLSASAPRAFRMPQTNRPKLRSRRAPATTPEIRVLSKEDQIKLRVKEHVGLWKQCLVTSREGPTERLRALLTAAQESQKSLQKLIDNSKIESYVKGWNPWEEKKIHFPAPPKKSLMKFKKTAEGKKQSSNTVNYSDPAKWKKVADLLKIADGLYQNLN